MLPTAMQKMMQKMMSTSLLCRMSTIRTLPATVPAARKAKVAVDGEAHVQDAATDASPELAAEDSAQDPEDPNVATPLAEDAVAVTAQPIGNASDSETANTIGETQASTSRK